MMILVINLIGRRGLPTPELVVIIWPSTTLPRRRILLQQTLHLHCSTLILSIGSSTPGSCVRFSHGIDGFKQVCSLGAGWQEVLGQDGCGWGCTHATSELKLDHLVVFNRFALFAAIKVAEAVGQNHARFCAVLAIKHELIWLTRCV